MNHQIAIKDFVEGSLQSIRFAVLATESDGQPHASLIAFTPIGGYRQLIFATYRSTRKYRNLLDNGKVAVFIDGRELSKSGLQEGFVLTVLGHAEEIMGAEHEAALHEHLERHPDLESFLRSADCALIRVMIGEYQIVRGIDNVRWWPIDEITATL